MSAPRALAPFLAFPQALRGRSFPVSPDQTESFVAAVGLLGPRSLRDVRLAARAVFGPAPERWEEFDAIFDAVFLGRAIAAPAEGGPEDMPPAFDAAGLELEPEAAETDPSGADATTAERLFARRFGESADEAALRAVTRQAARELPRRRSRRLKRAGVAPRIPGAPSASCCAGTGSSPPCHGGSAGCASAASSSLSTCRAR
jgi:uncharacterized protein with von Willebrand factor type A (vWA) domain